MLIMDIKKYEVSYELEKPEIYFSKATVSMVLNEEQLDGFVNLEEDDKLTYIKKNGSIGLNGIEFSKIIILFESIDVQEVLEGENSSIDYNDEQELHESLE